MIIPDANLLIYAYDEASPQHMKARKWWEALLSGNEPVGLPWIVVLAFTRIITHPQICQNPVCVTEARAAVTSWLDHGHVSIIQISSRALDPFFDLLEEADMGGNLSTDAMIAIHALEHGAIIHSNDRDFDRFSAIRWHNPLK